MAQAIKFQLFKFDIDIIYLPLMVWMVQIIALLKSCFQILFHYVDNSNNNVLIRAIISKLFGNALMLVGSCPEVRD